jgi:hypothetical protein
MAMPTEPVTLTPEQLAQLHGELSTLRHDVNNHLSLIMAAVELIRHKPQTAERMIATIAEQPPRIAGSINKFTADFAQAFGISRNAKGKHP